MAVFQSSHRLGVPSPTEIRSLFITAYLWVIFLDIVGLYSVLIDYMHLQSWGNLSSTMSPYIHRRGVRIWTLLWIENCRWFLEFKRHDIFVNISIKFAERQTTIHSMDHFQSYRTSFHVCSNCWVSIKLALEPNPVIMCFDFIW